MSGDRRARVEAFFRPADDEPGGRPTVVAFVALVALGVGATAWGTAGWPGGWLVGLVWTAPYVLAAYLLGWPRAAWAAAPAYGVSAAASHVLALVLMGSAVLPDLAEAAGRIALSVGLLALVVGVGATGGAAWLWDRVRRGVTGVRAEVYVGVLLLLPTLSAAAWAWVPGEWPRFPPGSWTWTPNGLTPLPWLGLGMALPLVAFAGLRRWRPAAGRTFRDRALAAGVIFVPVHVLGSAIVQFPHRASSEGVLGPEGVTFSAALAVVGMLEDVGETYLAVALAALASLWLLPHRYEPPSEAR